MFFAALQVGQSQGLIGSSVSTVQNDELVYGGAKYKGNPYLYNTWHPAVIVQSDGTVSRVEEAKFDVSSQKLLIKEGDKTMWVNDRQIKTFELKTGTDVPEIYARQIQDGIVTYMLLVKEGPLPILKSYYKEFKKPAINQNYQYGAENDITPYFDDMEMNYFTQIEEDGELVQFKLGKKGVTNLFPKSKEKRIKSLINKQNTKLKSEAEVVAFFISLESEFSK